MLAARFALLIPPALLLPLLTGCASPGQPRPPSLHLPAVATALHAQRIGPTVHLTWTTPAESTDGQGLRGPVTAVLCRDPHPPAHPGATCVRTSAFPVVPGPSSADDPLPPALLLGPPALLSYRVQLFNSAGRAADPSAPVLTASGPAPAPLGPLHITPTRRGALVAWAPTPDPSPVELTRTTTFAAPPAGSGKPPRTPATPAAPHRSAPPASITLRAEPPAPAQADHDSGGLRDPGVLPGNAYRYTAQRVRTITLPSPSGPPVEVEVRGLPSPPSDFAFRDVFPPQPPAGLVAIASPGDPASPTTNPAAVDLSWEPGLEPDLLGYNVYRAANPSGPFLKLNPAPLPGPAFRDLQVATGKTYLYQVTAVDRSGNESEASTPMSETVPHP